MKKLPEGWREVRLEEICEVNMGQSPKSETYNENNIGLPLIQGNADIKNRKTLPKVYTSEPTKQCDIGDIIMTVRAPVGAIAKSYHNACIGRGVCALKPKENNDFLYHFLVNYEDKWNKLSQGSTFTAVNGNDIKNIKILYPPLEEQKKIAEILSTVDQKIDFVDKQIEETETLKKGLMQKLLTQGIGHSEFKDSEVGRIPKSWKVVRLEDITEVVTKGTTPTTLGYQYENHGINFIKVESIDKNGNFDKNLFAYISEEANIALKRSIILENDLLYSIAGALGRVAIVNNSILPANTNQALAIIRLKNKSSVNYIYFYLHSSYIKNHINKINVQNAQANLSLQNIRDFKIAMPPLQEQKQIAEILSTVDQKIENLKAKKEAFEELKKGLMQKLLTGEVRVKL